MQPPLALVLVLLLLLLNSHDCAVNMLWDVFQLDIGNYSSAASGL